MFPAASGYDRAITVFSPDGRLYQVEYAIETVRRGTLAVGVRSNEGIVIAVEERTRKLQTPSVVQKIFEVDTHLGIAAAGYIPDARVQVDQARNIAQSNKLIYDEKIDVESVAKKLADMSQQFTQYAGVRPFGVSLILGGVDQTGPSIFLTDPSGTYLGYDAVAIGAGSDQVNDFLDKKYASEITLDQACVLAIESIYLVSEDKIATNHVKMAVIDAKTQLLSHLDTDKIASLADKASTRKTRKS